MTNDDGTLAPELLMDLLKEKNTEVRESFGHHLTATTVYIGVTGALLKFALDANATIPLGYFLGLFGILFSVMMFLTTFWSERFSVKVFKEIHGIMFELGRDPDNLLVNNNDETEEKKKEEKGSAAELPFHYLRVFVQMFAGATLVGWSTLLVLLYLGYVLPEG